MKPNDGICEESKPKCDKPIGTPRASMYFKQVSANRSPAYAPLYFALVISAPRAAAAAVKTNSFIYKKI